jgi:hypothetical protein
MLCFLWDNDTFSERKARLFGAAAGRRIWDLLPDERSRNAIKVAERFADGLAPRWALEVAHAEAHARCMEGPAWAPATEAVEVAEDISRPTDMNADIILINAKQARATANTQHFSLELWNAESEAQCDLLRDIIGNPFQPPPPLPEGVLAWNEGFALKFATAIYEGRDFTRERMGVLADALEEAGVMDAPLLEHLRGPGPHTRGCFAIDLALGKG